MGRTMNTLTTQMNNTALFHNFEALPKVLVVDDDSTIVGLLKLALESNGVWVQAARCGRLIDNASPFDR